MFGSICGPLKNHFLALFLLLVVIAVPTTLQAQVVDCSGSNPDPTVFPSITAALTNVASGTWITVIGPCNESVAIFGLNNIGVSAVWGQTATVNGGLSIQNSENINLYGLNFTNSAGDGIQIGRSHAVTVDSCSSSGNAGRGLSIDAMSDVVINATGAFNNNGDNGIAVNGPSSLQMVAWGGPATASGNKNSGVYASGGSYVISVGNTTIENTSGVTANGLVSGFGIDLRGRSALQLGTIFGSNTIQNNHSGGLSLQENSEASFWGGPNLIGNGALNVIQNNGPVGVAAGFGTQVTFFDCVYVAGHTDYGVDLYANSQLYATGKTNRFVRNGTGTELLRSGLRVDCNSEAYFRGGLFAQNGGPGNGAGEFQRGSYGCPVPGKCGRDSRL